MHFRCSQHPSAHPPPSGYHMLPLPGGPRVQQAQSRVSVACWLGGACHSCPIRTLLSAPAPLNGIDNTRAAHCDLAPCTTCAALSVPVTMSGHCMNTAVCNNALSQGHNVGARGWEGNAVRGVASIRGGGTERTAPFLRASLGLPWPKAPPPEHFLRAAMSSSRGSEGRGR